MTIEEVQIEMRAKVDEMQAALDADDIDKAEAIKAEIEEYKEMIKQLEAELKEVEGEEQPEESTEEKSGEDEEVEQRDAKDDKIAELEAELEKKKAEESAKENKKLENEGERNMTEIIEEVVLDNKEEVRSNFQNFIKNNEVRDLTTDSGAVIVPEYLAKEVQDFTDELEALDKHVTIESVTTKSGSKPVYNGDAAKPLVSVPELEENPKLAVQPLTDVKFDIETYRAYLPISREAIEDGIGAETLVKKILAESVVSTRNAHILAVLNTFATTEVSDLDGLKDIINVELKPRHQKHFIMSQTVYNMIDKMKDNNGQYLLQNSISAASGKQVFGLEVVVFEDALIGANTAYVGNLAEAVVIFDRSQYSAQWTSYMHHAECLMVAIRHDVKELNKDAVVKINFTAPVEVPEA
ncbi:phage major capsid protein [Jeotgalicoccus halotolerans]|uniref:phage major capsid protein n=1 Tax=Jeotgalicoccus halotolerans TaxID=157227 RepID=UPI0035175F2A